MVKYSSAPKIAPAIDGPVRRLYAETLGPYWPSERSLVENGYRDVEFPFDEVAAPDLAIERSMTLAAFAGYVGTWSATRRYRDATRVDPVPGLLREIEEAWGAPHALRLVRWPLAIRAGR